MKLIGFLLRLIILVAVAVWLADQPGNARLVWHGYVIETSAAFLALAVLAVGYVFYLLFRFWHLLRHGPEQWRIHRKLKKLRQGQDQLEKGFTAIAGGNAAEAGRLSLGARKSLGETTATRLLQAQAAQLAGDHRAAREIFRALAANNDSAILGYRGLIMEARREKDWGEVASLVEKMQRIRRDIPWLDLVRFDLLSRRQEWQEADLVMARVIAARLIDPARAKQYRAAVLVAKSQAEARQKQANLALQTAEEAARQSPVWLPAILNLAERQLMAGHMRAARRTVEKNWETLPHPRLAAIYRAGHDDALEAYRQIERLCRDNADAPLSRHVLAEAALGADIWGEARRQLIALVSRNEATQSVYKLLARLERRETGNEQAALQWLTKAAEAAPDPVWLCRACGGSHEEWLAVCTHCGEFDGLEWQSPGRSRAPRAVMPLLAESMMD